MKPRGRLQLWLQFPANSMSFNPKIRNVIDYGRRRPRVAPLRRCQANTAAKTQKTTGDSKSTRKDVNWMAPACIFVYSVLAPNVGPKLTAGICNSSDSTTLAERPFHSPLMGEYI